MKHINIVNTELKYALSNWLTNLGKAPLHDLYISLHIIHQNVFSFVQYQHKPKSLVASINSYTKEFGGQYQHIYQWVWWPVSKHTKEFSGQVLFVLLSQASLRQRAELDIQHVHQIGPLHLVRYSKWHPALQRHQNKTMRPLVQILDTRNLKIAINNNFHDSSV